MAAIGRLTSAVVVVVLIGGVVIGVRSVPDIKRYLRMRSM